MNTRQVKAEQERMVNEVVKRKEAEHSAPPCVVCGKPAAKSKAGMNGNGLHWSGNERGYGWRKTCSDECLAGLGRSASSSPRMTKFQKQAGRMGCQPEPTQQETDPAPLSMDSLVVLDGDTEPRALDTDIAERAGMAQPRNVRQVIENNREELEEHGAILERTVRVPSRNRHGEMEREVPAYYLNEGQALNLLSLLRTEAAKKFRPLLIKVFLAYRRRDVPTQVPAADDDSLVHILAAATDAKFKKLSERVESVEETATRLMADHERATKEALEAERKRAERIEAEAKARDEAERKERENTMRTVVETVTASWKERRQPRRVKETDVRQVWIPTEEPKMGADGSSILIKHSAGRRAEDVVDNYELPGHEGGGPIELNGNRTSTVDYARTRVYAHMRRIAEVKFGRPLRMPITQMPKSAYEHCMEAIESDDMLSRLLADLDARLAVHANTL